MPIYLYSPGHSIHEYGAHSFFLNTYTHKVHIYLVECLSPHRNSIPLPPLPQAIAPPPPPRNQRVGHTAGEGSQFGRLQKKPSTMSALCLHAFYSPSLFLCLAHTSPYYLHSILPVYVSAYRLYSPFAIRHLSQSKSHFPPIDYPFITTPPPPPKIYSPPRLGG
jgi:hypothetical protein